ncbi:TonB-dependent receptor-like protein [Novosphingobium kunmingense]|uniref:TonB-dependent receptor-like protein n=1 Tax=Novosphingobium kunmingense TaxID=1211806 RepID=A0A2N0HKX1_9SPHN|nr:TonB-dependent receptor [Novosphingobium kunmingense]PKB19611.1 TonB-dependent receptor-like protein [Novosphingobium kunmingense]
MINTLFNGNARAALLAGLAVPALALPQMAFAQEEAQPATDEAQADVAIEEGNEIVVTATKREQTLQDTPVAVSVTSAATIERAQIRDIADLASVVPSLKVSTSQNSFATTYAVRGFGTSGNNLGLEPSVAVFVDGVYRSRSMAQISDLPDIQRVEVLRGPQSTLFGKNASAGVISIVTKEPSYTFGGSVEATYGNFDAMTVKGYVTAGLSDTIAASIAGGYNRRDGYVTNAFNGDDIGNRNRWFGRGQVRFDPSDALKIRLIADYDQIDEKCCAVFNLRRSAATGAVNAVGGQVNDAATIYDDVVYTDVVPFNKVRNWGLSGQMDYEFGPLTLTSITAYRDTDLKANQDVDFSSGALATGANIGQASLKTFTQELRLASDLDGPLNFLVGGYYFNEKVKTADQIVYGNAFRNYANLLIGGTPTSPPNDLAVDQLEAQFSALTGRNLINTFFQSGQGFFNAMDQKNEAWSLFGQVDLKPTERLTITLGGNYTHDSKDVTTSSVSTDVFSSLDLNAIRTTATSFGIAQTVGGILGVPGGIASATQIAGFAALQPALFQQIQAGAAAATAPILALRPLQFLPPFQNCPNAVESCSTRDGNFSYTARLAYEISDTLNVYASYATGFKASSFNLSRDSRPTLSDLAALRAANLAVTNLTSGSRFSRPEKSKVYEVGIKGNWGLASANLTFFKQSIEDFQVNNFTGTGYIFSNADKQSTFGIEFDGRVNPTRELTLMLAMTYLDPKYDSYVNSPFGDVSGTQIVNISKLSATFGAQYERRLANDDRLIARTDFNYSAPVQVQPGLLNYIGTNANGTPNYAPARDAARPFGREVNDLNASLTYAMANGLELSVWGRNLLDDRYLVDIFDSVAQRQSVSGYTNQPRTYGVAARFKW